MKSKTRLESAVFQLTPTRTRCDLYVIANGKKEKIASGLLNPFIAHLKAAQDQIAEGGYSVLLAPEAGSNATWFTKCTVESFVRFVSTPEILERVFTIESEIIQIEEAISIQGNSDILIKDQCINPVASNEGKNPACDVDGDEMAIVLYKTGAHELSGSSAKERNSKVQLIDVLETRKAVLKKEQGMAFARAVAAGFDIEHVANLLSFAECFGASRLMSGCLRFMDLWRKKRESGQWVEIEAEEAMPNSSTSGIVLSSMSNEPSAKARGADDISETPGSNTNPAGGEQQYHGGQLPGLPPWVMHSSPQGGVPVYQAYPVPYYQHYPGFYPPPYPSSIEDPSHFQKRQSMDNNNNRYNNTEPEAENEEERSEQCKNAGKSKSGRVVIRNINFINSKNHTSSDSVSSDTDADDHTQERKRNLKSPKKKGNRKDSESETRSGKETDGGGHWDAFQTYLLKSAAEGDREDMFAMEKDPKTKRCQKTMAVYDPLLAHAKHNDDSEERMQYYDTSGRKIVYRSANNDDGFMMVGRREETNVRYNGFEEANLDRLQHDDAVMVSLRSTSGVNDYNLTSGLKMFDLPKNNSNKTLPVVKYEPDVLSLMPERDVENSGYDRAMNYEMQLAASHSKQDKKGSKSAEQKHQLSKPNQGVVRKGRPSKVNNNIIINNNNKNTLEAVRARADKLRSYKADLQKMKKEQQDAELKRLEALKIERQKRISARTTGKQLPASSKLSPISHTKFTDSEPGSSSPLQRSKIKPTSISISQKPSASSHSSNLTDRNHPAPGNRITRSLSVTKNEMSSVTTTSESYKASSITRIRRLSEPKKINSTPHATTNNKPRSAEPVSKPKSSDGRPTETKKICAASDKSKAADLKVTSSSNPISQKMEVIVKSPVATTSQAAKLNSNNRFGDADADADANPVIDKTVVTLEYNKQPSSVTTKEFNSNLRTGMNIHEVPLPDKETISVHPQKHSATSFVACVEEGGKKYEAPYARASSFEDQSTRNSNYAKAPRHHQPKFGGDGTEKAYVFDNLKKTSESKGGFKRLLKLGKRSHNPTPSVPHPHPRVSTLKSLISEDETPAQKSSRRLFSFQLGDKTKVGSSRKANL